MSSAKRESVTVLEECIDLQKRKSNDYQNERSNIVQAMHYRRGVSTIHDMISQKLLRAQSLLEAYENGDNASPNFESLEDTYKDLINYASFAVSYLRGKMEGQDSRRDMLNRPNALREFVNEKLGRDTYIIKPPLGGTGTVQEVTKEEFETHISDRSGGFSPGQVDIEDDGFVTVVPTSFSGFYDEPQKIPLSEEKLKDLPTEAKLNCTDSVQHAYVKSVKSRRKPILDISNRMDEDIKEHIEKIEDRK